MDDHYLYTKDLGRTFINYKHEEISSIDYIFLDKELFENNSSYLKLDSCSSLVSDHYPITCRLNVKIEHRQQSTKILPTNRKIKWSTIDVNLYEENVNKSLTAISSEIQSGQELTKVITQVNTIMKNAAIESAPRAKVYNRKKQKPKIRSFKTNQASKRCKEAFAKWKANERPTSPNNKIYCDMKFAKYELRKTCRIEIAMKVLNDRQEILDARTKHDQVFYKLLGKKKGKLKNCISELNVQDNIYKSDNEIIVGWKQHFNKLAQPANDPEYDDEYYKQLALDLDNIIDICNNQTNTISVTEKDVQDAINGLKINKSPDIYSISSENIKYGGDKLQTVITNMIVSSFKLGVIPEILKMGLLTPVFKNKGSNKNAT
ncbi:Hypothetical predicted protein [Mytilus galloprovincialis]|uniref:Endonuclease/exonuclease/phosphatase domain-containing protein n=1 Tax=Mytilus galloprovincialis TaxID=29158 RepID=A0A8B6H8D0_MYTGA|nr:Hypothetical predicted protein [Mytilus galloprovincialis]